MQLHEKFGDRITAVTLNLDYSDADEKMTDELRERIIETLKKQKVTCRNFISSDLVDDVFKKSFRETGIANKDEEPDVTTLPSCLVYGADGKLAKVFPAIFSYEDDVAPFVESLLVDGSK